MTRAECAAYAAGLFDGEGSVMLMAGPSNARYRVRLKVSLCQVDQDCLHWLVANFGGKIRQRNNKVSERCRIPYEWYLLGSAAAAFLQEIRPYLILKDAQADLALEFMQTIQKKGGVRVPVSDFVVRLRERQRLLMKDLNRRGVAS